MQTSTSVNDYLRDHIRTVSDWPAKHLKDSGLPLFTLVDVAGH